MTQERRAIFLPEDLSIDGKAASSVLHRSIFDVNVFTANLALEGASRLRISRMWIPTPISVRWRDAVLVLAISDVAGLKEAATVTINGSDTLPFAPSVGLPGRLSPTAFMRSSAEPPRWLQGDAPLKPFTFRADLVFTRLAGADVRAGRARNESRACVGLAASELHRLVPAGRAQRLSDRWLLRRRGACRILPVACRMPGCSAATAGSIASASISSASRSTSQSISTTTSLRAVKYGILFLAVGFMGVFVLELLSTKRVHAVQYLFVGLAMVFFYVLLLSLSEHIGFTMRLSSRPRRQRAACCRSIRARCSESRTQRAPDARAVRACCMRFSISS